ncbi:hypothetical protein P261_01334 [Lachnospiraceae bacterium TWA4]|nr:hypothetical protein P261_01334 [Lachnospiraceae bacterium TWA4]
MTAILTTAIVIQSEYGGKTVWNNKLQRPDYGKKSITYELRNSYSDEDIKVVVDPREYPKEELEGIFEEVYQELLSKLLGNNQSLSEVYENLVFSQPEKYAGVTAQWIPKNYKFIDSEGVIYTDSVPKEGIDTSIQLFLNCQKEEKSYEINLTIVSKPLSIDEKEKKQLENYINDSQEDSKTEEYFSLPTEYNGNSLEYYEDKSEHTEWIIFIIGIVIAALLVINEDIKLKTKVQDRDKQMMIDYSQIVSKLTILIGAGMSIKGAWIRIVEDYQNAKKDKSIVNRYAYEEMTYTSKQMLDGLPESEAYLEFGRRCHLHPYLKLSSLLEQSLRKGTKGVIGALQSETTQAFLERKHLAKRYGEKMSTKLMMPMMLLFAMVLMMIMVPAFLSF